MTINDLTKRVTKLFNHGDMSFHLAKLLEESGELAKAVNKDEGCMPVVDEVADVVLSALLIGQAYCRDRDINWDSAIEFKLKQLESNPTYRNFQPPPRGVDRRHE